MEYVKNLHILDELNASADIMSEETQIKNEKRFEKILWWKSFWKYANVLGEVKTFYDFKVNVLAIVSLVYNWLPLYLSFKKTRSDIQPRASKRDIRQISLYAFEYKASKLYADQKMRDNGLCPETHRDYAVWHFYGEYYMFIRIWVYHLFRITIRDKYLKMACANEGHDVVS